MRYLQELFEHHTRTRFAERFKLRVTDGELRYIARYIDEGGGIVLKSEPDARVMVAVPAGPEGKLVPVIYSNKHQSIVTVLPRNRLFRFNRKLKQERRKLMAMGRWPLRVPTEVLPEVQLVPDGHPGKVLVWCEPSTCPFRVAIDLREENGQRLVDYVYYPNGCARDLEKFRRKMRKRFKNPYYTGERLADGAASAERFITALLGALERENIRWETSAS